MGEAVYSLKAQFKSKKEAKVACKDFNKFLDENDTVQDNTATGPSDLKNFPRIKEYLQIIKGDWDDVQAFRYDEEQAYCEGDVLIFCANVGHLGDWGNLQTFIEKKYKAIKVVWGSEEYGGSLDALNLYEWEAIVKNILKCEKTLPILLDIHPDLNALIAIQLGKGV